ncbi:MAG: hypothetical protein EOR73_05840 [Mesorhizobium sp.]|nr:MAG: hypothetical protein EOR73_05840 [Mesorhizobium sp.]
MQLIDYKGVGMAMSEMVRSLSPMRIMLGKAAMLVFKDFWIGSWPHQERRNQGSARDAGEDHKWRR